MIASSIARGVARKSLRPAARAFHSTPVARGGNDGGYEYLHAKYMYNFRNKPGSKLRVGGLMLAGVCTGVGIPLFAVEFNQKKAGLK